MYHAHDFEQPKYGFCRGEEGGEEVTIGGVAILRVEKFNFLARLFKIKEILTKILTSYYGDKDKDDLVDVRTYEIRYDQERSDWKQSKVTPIEDKIRETTCKQFGHVMRRNVDAPKWRCKMITLPKCKKVRGRPKKME